MHEFLIFNGEGGGATWRHLPGWPSKCTGLARIQKKGEERWEEGKRRKRRGTKKKAKREKKGKLKDGNHWACAKTGPGHPTVTTVRLGVHYSDFDALWSTLQWLRCAWERARRELIWCRIRPLKVSLWRTQRQNFHNCHLSIIMKTNYRIYFDEATFLGIPFIRYMYYGNKNIKSLKTGVFSKKLNLRRRQTSNPHHSYVCAVAVPLSFWILKRKPGVGSPRNPQDKPM